MENRGLNVKTAEERLDKIEETLKSPVQELEIGNDNKKKIYKETSKVKILKEKLFADSPKTAQRIKETQIENYLAKFDLKGKDCANAFSIKLLYAELCSREFAYEHGYRPQTHEEKLKALRKQKGLTQTQFAIDFNIATGTIGMWETGKRQPDYNLSLIHI